MDVTCDRCQAEYEFEETLISPTGTAVKCTTCGHLFKVMPPAPTPAAAPAAGRRWTLRKTSGEAIELPSLVALSESIAKGEVNPDDEISHTGRRWRRVGDIPELSALFVRRAAADDPTQSEWLEATEPTRPKARLPYPDDTDLDILGLSASPRSQPPLPEPNMPHPPRSIPPPMPPQPLGESGDAPGFLPEPLVTGTADTRGAFRQPGAMWLVASVLLGAVVAVAGAWLMMSQSGDSTPALAPAATRYVEEGDQALAQHDPVHFEKAVTAYTKALAQHEHDPYLLSALSRTYALWSQYLRTDERLRSVLTPDDTAKIETLTADATRWAERARTAAETAARKNPGNAAAELALADALRLNGNLVAARAEFDRADAYGDGTDPEAARVAAWLAIDEAGGAAGAGRKFAEQAVAQAPSSVAYRTLLTYVLLALGDTEAAAFHLERLRVEAPGAELTARLQRWATQLTKGDKGGADAADAPGDAATEGELATDSTASIAERCQAGNAALARQRLSAARGHFAAVLSADAESGCALLGMGQVYLRRGQSRRALALLRKAARGGKHEAWVGVGTALQALERLPEAERAYTKYLRVAPRGRMAERAKQNLQVIREALAETAKPAPKGAGMVPAPRPRRGADLDDFGDRLP